MHSVHPLADPVLWARWLGAAALLLWLPGHLLLGRASRDLDPLSCALLSLGAGLLIVAPVGCAYAVLRVPLTPATYLPPVLLLSLLAGSRRALRDALAAWGQGLPRLGRVAQAALLLAAVASGVLLGQGFRDLPAPPAMHDAGNHAFITARIASLATLDPEAIFSPDIGRPDVLYLTGWHAAAALVARLGGIAPYVSTWYLPLLVMVLVPASLTLLWRAVRVPVGVAVVAGLMVVVNPRGAAGLLGKGGFGQIIGMFLVPVVLLGLRALFAAPSRRQGVMAGAALGAIFTVHASQGVSVLFLVPLIWLARRDGPNSEDRGWQRRRLVAGLIACGVCALVAATSSGGIVGAYARKIIAMPAPLIGPLEALRQYLGSGGIYAISGALAALGLMLGARGEPYRRLVVASLLLGLFFAGLACWRNPVIDWLSIPFYREYPRVQFLQNFILPPLMTLPLALLWRVGSRGASPGGARREARGGRIAARVAAVAVLLLTLLPPLPRMLASYREMHRTAPFTAAEYELATVLPAIVAPDEVVANFLMDGSAWAMHVSHPRFLQPCSWSLKWPDGTRANDIVVRFAERPWPPDVRALRERGVRWLYVSNLRVDYPGAEKRSRSTYAADDRFEAVRRGGQATLYRVLWDRD